MEKKISEWVAGLTLGEDEEALMYVPREEQEAAMREWEADGDPLRRQVLEDEKRMEWKFRPTTERKRRMEAATEAAKELEEIGKQRAQMAVQVDLLGKVEILARNVERLPKVQEEQLLFGRGQDIVVRSIRPGLRDFARELAMQVGSHVTARLEGSERYCVGTIEGAKLTAPKEEEARPRRSDKVKFPDSYSGKKEKNFDNWEANVKTYVHLQKVSPDDQVLIAIHALKEEAASFARSLVRAANCSNDVVAYSAFTPLADFLKLLRKRFADVSRSVRACDRLWRSAKALKGVMDELVATPDHGVTKTQLVNLFYRAMPESGRTGALVDSGATRSYISRKALQKLKLQLKVQRLADPIVSILADNRTMRVEEYVEGVQLYFRLEQDGKVEKVLHSLTLLVEDSLPFDIVLGMDWGGLHLREHEWRLPSPSGGVKTARLFHVSGVDSSLSHCCLSVLAFARLVKKEQLEEQDFVAYVRPVTEPKEEKPIDPAIAKLLEEFTDLAKPPIGVVSRLIQHRIEMEPGSRTPKGAVYRMSPRELEELRKQLDELLEKGWIRPSSSPFGAPVMSIPKKEGELRMCIDYRGLNAITVKNVEPLPRIDDLLDRVQGCRLLRKETSRKWDKDCTSAMKKLKQALIEYPVLKVADPSLPFAVTTDTSQYGKGAVLQQDDGNGYRRVEFMSVRMPSEKVATSTYERELYALRQALEHWKHYLLGRHFKVYSDHETLRWLKTQAKMTPKLTRWAAEIDQYDFELRPVKGKYNVVGDALSRRADWT
ncbi:hypothetical protein CBR_g11965 [Chara braunii]|uniref:RNA-directed DNA polymerase n=1 Tax=Chara braunii TaxID=69332 RepID=A0A388KQS2_CHABU|nr:hypothetical protein CBR_g11965 [Chara braunii]|eukprot:GBG72387.1 hypothetical protein CBR_g11965 [Chara braunii]